MLAIWTLTLLSALAGEASASNAAPEVAPKGKLVIDGGGTPSKAVYKRTLEMAGGSKAKIVLLPQGSSSPSSGPKGVRRWLDVGAEDVQILDLADPKAAVEVILHADLIWIGGGDQINLMRKLQGTGVPEAIRQRYRDGAIVGGASAGAAVMSKIMIARGVEEFPKPLANFPLFGEGLGLWPGVIVDQHFLKRHRTDRLRLAVGEYPDCVGVGIDESTAVIVSGNSFEVVGESRVVVIDNRAAELKAGTLAATKTEKTDGGGDGLPPADPQAGRKTATLDPGMIYDLDRGIIPIEVAEKR